MITVGSLCSGIGGIELGLEMTGGFTTVFQAEIDPFARAVLRKHWPHAQLLEDMRLVSRNTVPRVDLICAGLPCQPHSLAGKRQASNDKRDLWGEFARIVGDLEPRWLLVENVPGILTSSDPAFGRDYPGAYFGRILSDLAALGYDAEWECIRAADVGAPHKRERMFLLAHPASGGKWTHAERSAGGQPQKSFGGRGGPQKLADAQRGGLQGGSAEWTVFRTQALPQAAVWGHLPAPYVCRGADGIPHRAHRTRALGNAVVPQVARWIGERILDAERGAA